MLFKQKRRAGGRVTPSFIRNIRKGYLQLNGTPVPGKEREADVLLMVLSSVQDGNYLRGMNQAKRNGFDLEKMYRDYRLMILECNRGDLAGAIQRFCDKHQTPIRLRTAA